jgi:hypothetical protein
MTSTSMHQGKRIEQVIVTNLETPMLGPEWKDRRGGDVVVYQRFLFCSNMLWFVFSLVEEVACGLDEPIIDLENDINSIIMRARHSQMNLNQEGSSKVSESLLSSLSWSESLNSSLEVLVSQPESLSEISNRRKKFAQCFRPIASLSSRDLKVSISRGPTFSK